MRCRRAFLPLPLSPPDEPEVEPTFHPGFHDRSRKYEAATLPKKCEAGTPQQLRAKLYGCSGGTR